MSSPWQIVGPECSLEQVLALREHRAAAQQRVRGRGTLVCLSLNIPGPVKRYPLADEGFATALAALDWQLVGWGFSVTAKYRQCHPAGQTGYRLVAGEPLAVKRCALALEKSHPLGRLMDVDVFGPEGGPLSRGQLGEEPRRCLLCENPAAQCGRSRAHGIEAVAQGAANILKDYFQEEYCQWISAQGVNALLQEVACAPKPGLVDWQGSGAHGDMDRFTFLTSAAGLGQYFAQVARAGCGFEGPTQGLLPLLRPLGLAAEAGMLASTGGINTHKGAIFSLGILCAAGGWLWGRGRAVCPKELLATAGEIAGGALEDFQRLPPDTHGLRLRQQQGAGGVRAQAAAGFPAIAQGSLPVLRGALARGFSWNGACLVALLHLLGRVEDTNLLHRGGEEGLRWVMAQARGLEGQNLPEEALVAAMAQLGAQMTCRNLSPGGCADLLAATLLVHFLTQKPTSFFDR